MRQIKLIGLIALGIVAGAQVASATQPGRCTLLSEITSATILATEPARVCSVEFFSTSDDSWAQVFDANTVDSSVSRKTISEPSGPTGIAHAFVDLGEIGHVTEFGLGVEVSSGTRVIIRWGK